MTMLTTVLAWIAAALAVVLVLLWVATQLLIARAERRFPVLGQRVTVDDAPQHVVVQGNGAPLVLIHGAFGGVQDFTATVMPALARDHRVIAADRPGHGYSVRAGGGAMTPDRQAEVLHGVLQQVQPGPVTLVGFSWGASVALAYALAYPQDVRAVVILNGATFPWPTGLSPTYAWSVAPIIGPLFRNTLLTPVAALIAESDVANAFDPEPVPASFAQSPVALSVRPESFAANAWDMLCLKEFLRAQSRRYGELRMPLVIVTGSGDQVVSPEIHAKALHAAMAGSELRVLPGAGHQILYTRPADVLSAIARAEEMAGK